jgi:hypothetical protein
MKLYVFTMFCVLSIGPAIEYCPRRVALGLFIGLLAGIIGLIKRELHG